jgi:hypothetical protein
VGGLIHNPGARTAATVAGGRFALWLLPDAAARQWLAALIHDLAREFQTVAFEPHLTLLGGIHGAEPALTATLANLADRMKAMALRPSAVQYRPEYFRSVYIGIVSDAALDQSRGDAAALYGGSAAAFEPHISLLYGDLPEETKHVIAVRLSDRLPHRIPCDRVALYDLAGKPDAWSAVATVSLGK